MSNSTSAKPSLHSESSLRSGSSLQSEEDVLLLSSTREMGMLQRTLEQYKPDVDQSRLLFVHALRQNMKHQQLNEKITHILQHPVLTKAAEEDYVKFAHQVMTATTSTASTNKKG